MKDNIVLGNVSLEGDQEFGILKAMEISGFDEVCRTSGLTLNSMLGTVAGEGVNLSGGEWQRLAIARCFYDNSKNLIVLDEPHASLDPKAEVKMYEYYGNIILQKAWNVTEAASPLRYSTFPPLGWYKPRRILQKVVFPLPFSPTTAIFSPHPMSTLTSSNASYQELTAKIHRRQTNHYYRHGFVGGGVESLAFGAGVIGSILLGIVPSRSAEPKKRSAYVVRKSLPLFLNCIKSELSTISIPPFPR